MKEQYIKQVEKELSLPRKMKKEVVRDLNEVFASAMEHGETEQQVIQRLGTPKEFADSTAEQFGIDCASRKGFKVPLNFPLQASVPPLSGVFQQCIARRTKRLAPCPMHATTIPAHHEGNGFGLLFLVQVLKSFLFYT